MYKGEKEKIADDDNREMERLKKKYDQDWEILALDAHRELHEFEMLENDIIFSEASEKFASFMFEDDPVDDLKEEDLPNHSIISAVSKSSTVPNLMDYSIHLPNSTIDVTNDLGTLFQNTHLEPSRREGTNDFEPEAPEIESSSVSQQLLRKYFKTGLGPKVRASDDTNVIKLISLESENADLQGELAKMKVQVTRLKREKEELERKEALARSEKEKEVNWLTQEAARIKEEYSKEMKRLRKERKDWETQKKLNMILPNKREREEFETLKLQMNEQNEKWKEKEGRLYLTQDRLKKKIIDLEKKNKEIAEEVRVLERERLALQFGENHIPTVMESQIEKLPKSRTPKQNMRGSFNTRKGNETSDSELSVNPIFQEGKNFQNKITNRTEISSRQVRNSENHEIAGIQGAQLEPKRITEFDAAKTDLDQLQRELGFEKYQSSSTLPNGSRERIYKDGSKLKWQVDGTMKLWRFDNLSVSYFNNGDSKSVYPDGRIVYWYNGPKTRHTTFPDNVQVCEFEDGQLEKRYPDNTLVIEFPDKTVKTIMPDGKEKILYPDGLRSEIQVIGNSSRIYNTYPDGIIELITDEMTSKLYTNGIIKMIFPDGTEETRWPSGKVRFKDKEVLFFSYMKGNIQINQLATQQ